VTVAPVAVARERARNLHAAKIEFSVRGDCSLQCGMIGINTGVKVADLYTLAGKSGSPELCSAERTDTPCRSGTQPGISARDWPN
jgi:hypothetical protein